MIASMTQFRQESIDDAPLVDDHVPETQLMQIAVDVEPVADDHVPKMQWTHVIVDEEPLSDDILAALDEATRDATLEWAQ